MAQPTRNDGAEARRLAEARARTVHWRRWGPFLSERAWGTVREDYSADGNAWGYFPHDHARSRVYRWNEDGIGGICDRHGLICFAIALWNERDPILKERLFGLSAHEGNHGEDVKEQYYYLDATPTHSFGRMLYKYPQTAFPYAGLVEENRRRGRSDPEYELIDTGVFADNRYFDVFVEHAKADAEDILVRVRAINRGPERAPLHLIGTLWCRNTWAWGRDSRRPRLEGLAGPNGTMFVNIEHPYYGSRRLYVDRACELLFTDNETNARRLFGMDGPRFAKDAFDDLIVHGDRAAVNPQKFGTKVGAHLRKVVEAGQAVELRFRLVDRELEHWEEGFDELLSTREREADEFYAHSMVAELSEDARRVCRQAYAGLLFSKQFYHYVVRDWLNGDPSQPPPPPSRASGRNRDWTHLYNADVLLMPDTWEYPWYASWDLAFHCVALAAIDPEFAKGQLVLLLREWYLHPNGQLPAYEWALSDVNPPVHAWAALRVYRIERELHGHADRAFLERVFHKLLLNFTWWVNRKDREGSNLFEGGFLGLDNIGVFDRNKPLPSGYHFEQSDGTSWMAMYTLDLLAIATELALDNPAYEDVASKFWEHFIYIAHAMNHRGPDDVTMWDEQDGFYYDVLHLLGRGHVPVRARSMVGLIPLFAVEVQESQVLDRLPNFRRRRDWFIENRPDLTENLANMAEPGDNGRRLLSIVDPEKLRRILKVMLDENEFLSPYGIRALSKAHREHPCVLDLDGQRYSLDYEPGESMTPTFGGNSNWRGPIWFPVNYLLIESLETLHRYLGEGYRVECPTGSGAMLCLREVAAEIGRRLTRLFLRDQRGRRVLNGGRDVFDLDPHFRDLVTYHEYFHGDDGRGLGATHQTGWTALIADLLARFGHS